MQTPHCLWVFLLLSIISIESIFSLKFSSNACKNYDDYRYWFVSKDCYYNPDILSDAPTIIRRAGYRFEGYAITTSDGYVLNLLRIPARNNLKNQQPVFLQNGILVSSLVWVSTGNRSLAFVLSDLGYDVWMGGLRGTSQSKSHRSLKTSDNKYWNFTLDTLAAIDLREQLKFVNSKTHKDGSIIYIGHSMGTTLGFMYASQYPEEARHLFSRIISIAPVAYFTNNSFVHSLVEIAPSVKNILKSRNIEGLYYQGVWRTSAFYTCSMLPHVCLKAVAPFFGSMKKHLRPEDLLLLVSFFPEGTSTNLLIQYSQIGESGKFRKFDYGRDGNYREYYQSEPPYYNLKNIKIPVDLFFGKKDPLVKDKSVLQLYNELGSTRKAVHEIPAKGDKDSFNHLDFLIAKDLKESFHKVLMEVLRN